MFQSCRDEATASWVVPVLSGRGVKCLAQRHNEAEVDFEPPTSRFGVRRSTTEPPRSSQSFVAVQPGLCRTLSETQVFSRRGS